VNICTAPNTNCVEGQTALTCQACGGMGQPCCATDSSWGNTNLVSCNVGFTCRASATGATCGP